MLFLLFYMEVERETMVVRLNMFKLGYVIKFQLDMC